MKNSNRFFLVVVLGLTLFGLLGNGPAGCSGSASPTSRGECEPGPGRISQC